MLSSSYSDKLFVDLQKHLIIEGSSFESRPHSGTKINNNNIFTLLSMCMKKKNWWNLLFEISFLPNNFCNVLEQMGSSQIIIP